MKDLGVYFLPRLDFTRHISYISQKAYRTLEFINRLSAGFRDPFIYITLYNALVRPLLEYASIIWYPNLENSKHVIESVTCLLRLIRHLGYKAGVPMPRFDHDYSYHEQFFGIMTLEKRGMQADLIFLVKLLKGLI